VVQGQVVEMAVLAVPSTLSEETRQKSAVEVAEVLGTGLALPWLVVLGCVVS
jgi:hypothetical protein